MWILGVATSSHDTGACLWRDDAMVRAVNEERLSRKKGDGDFPRRSIEWLMEAERLTVEDIDYVALGNYGGINSKDQEFTEICLRCLEENTPDGKAVIRERLQVSEERSNMFYERQINSLMEIGFPHDKIKCYNHHKCHAASAFYSSPFQDATVVIFDGRGDGLSTSVYSADRRAGLERLDTITLFDSIATLYSIITHFAGFDPFQHAGKITGLAAHGDSAVGTFDVLKKAIYIKQINEKWTLRANFNGYYKPFHRTEPALLFEELQCFNRADVAAGVQDLTEYLVVEYLRRNGFPMKRLCLAGGLFANVKLNQRLREMDGVEDVYVFPHMGDGGLAHGASALCAIDCGFVPTPMSHVFLGPAYDTCQIKQALDEFSLHGTEISHEDEFAAAVASYVNNGQIVGLFYGAMEFGPRALGHRSLVASTTDSSINQDLNDRLKRTEFMPFAPFTLREHAELCYVGWQQEHEASRFMTMSYNTTEKFQFDSPATVHIDGTARPQIVDARDGIFFKILQEYYRISGVCSLLNTSFNAHGEPIVCSPSDACRSFAMQNSCDILAIYPFIVVSKD